MSGAKSARQLLNESTLAIPLDAGVDARSVFDSVTASQVRTPNAKQLLLHARALRELLEDKAVDVLYWFDTEDMLADGIAKGSIDRRPLLVLGNHGTWTIVHDQPVHKSPSKDADRQAEEQD